MRWQSLGIRTDELGTGKLGTGKRGPGKRGPGTRTGVDMCNFDPAAPGAVKMRLLDRASTSKLVG